tara:strand:+ start:4526 stop:4882 length:357 start_codon:yes stop_codon:yes gene_type:complete
MELSSPRFKSLAVTAGFSFWFLIITFSLNIFYLEYFAIFVISILLITQIFSVKLSKGLDLFAIFNTKIFLGIFFISLISVYGIIFRFLKVDLLRLKKQSNSYWLKMEHLEGDRIFKQY